MVKEIVVTDSAPKAIGPYSQATVVDNLVYCSGQIPLDPATGELVSGSVADEATRCMQNLGAVLEAAGSSFKSVIKTTAYLTNMDDFPEFNDAYGAFFSDEPPARATVGVAALPKGARVEVECIAHRN